MPTTRRPRGLPNGPDGRRPVRPCRRRSSRRSPADRPGEPKANTLSAASISCGCCPYRDGTHCRAVNAELRDAVARRSRRRRAGRRRGHLHHDVAVVGPAAVAVHVKIPIEPLRKTPIFAMPSPFQSPVTGNCRRPGRIGRRDRSHRITTLQAVPFFKVR